MKKLLALLLFSFSISSSYSAVIGPPLSSTGGGIVAVNAQTGTTYTVLASDKNKLVTFSNSGAIAVSLPQATGTFGAGFCWNPQDIGVGTVTITPTTSTINGASTLTLTTNQGVTICSDGTNWQIGYGGLGGSFTQGPGIAITGTQISLVNPPLEGLLFVGPGAVAAQTCASVTLPVQGAKVASNTATVTPPAATSLSLIVQARIATDDIATIQICNPTAGSITPTTGNYVVVVQ